MESKEFDVLIIGAGAAGLAAGMRLSGAGRRVLMLEARERIGGRILTVESDGNQIELGAEFVHGKSPEIFDLVERFGLKTTEVDGDQFCNLKGKLAECDFFEQVKAVFDKLEKYEGGDISFEEFLNGVCEDEETRLWSRSYVAGFHGAPPQDAGVKALIADTKAEEDIDGQRSWRIEGGYRRLVDCMWQACEKNGVELRLNASAKRVEWNSRVRVVATQGEFVAKKAIVTLPVGVLQAGVVDFVPALREKEEALRGMAMGDVARCVLTFKSRWWKEIKSSEGNSLKNVSFLFSRAADFPTWWTLNPWKAPVLTGWASALTAPGLTGKSSPEITERALEALSKIVGVDVKKIRNELVNSHWHDWCRDPLTRGAYTYARVGGEQAYRNLANPVGGMLFFAGEATDATGNHATVHGAIASGYRAADELLSGGK